jgi:hypothetical protein
MVAVGVVQYGAAIYGALTGGPWRVAVMNTLVATANVILAGQR